MIKLKLADFIIQINNKYDFVERQCHGYIVDDGVPDLIIECTEEDIQQEITNYDNPSYANKGYCESICIYRNLCLQLPKYDAFLMHSAVLDVDGKSYAFTAKSGTGKSTHINLWKKLLGEKVTVVNGDKPILRFIDGELFIYGTPWCGKEGWNTNMRSTLKGLCFLERAEKNSIIPLEKSESAMRIMNQILMPSDPLDAMSTLELMDRMLMKVDTWLLGCNMDIEAAKIAYESMSGEKIWKSNQDLF